MGSVAGRPSVFSVEIVARRSQPYRPARVLSRTSSHRGERMALTYSIHHEDRLVIAVVDGAFVRRDVERYLADIFAAGCGSYGKLFDIVRAANLLDAEDMRALGSRIRILGAMGPMGPLAIVTSSALRPVATTFASFATAPRSIELFDAEPQARSWLARQLGSCGER